MSDYENPYQIPQAPVVPEKLANSGTPLSAAALRYLKEASPWMRFAGIVGIIFASLALLIGIIAFFSSVAYEEAADVFPAWLSLLYLPTGALLFLPSYFILKFGSKIRSYLINNLEEDLEAAFKNNKSFWKFTGIILIIYIAIIPVLFIITFIYGMSSLLPSLF
jgi:hypothetical protein